MNEEKDVVQLAFEKTIEKKQPKKIEYDFAVQDEKKFRSPWDRCVAPPSVGDWIYNRRRVDDAGYVPLDKQIKRMIADGERLLDFKHSPQYRAIYEELAKADEQLPEDDMLFMSRSDLLARAHELKDELESIRLNSRTLQGDVYESPKPKEPTVQTPEKNPPSAEKETVSTKPLEG
ncbi:hypothetical protein [Treponema succinifaciens]|uniref:hypothetical protein n=1 Tax=Treponema succinifaciens TaxID=167 RepID=UPI0023F19FE7|nr:hypothetical protein [Treponema succinifaciens]